MIVIYTIAAALLFIQSSLYAFAGIWYDRGEIS
jgi:hypothetical protein